MHSVYNKLLLNRKLQTYTYCITEKIEEHNEQGG